MSNQNVECTQAELFYANGALAFDHFYSPSMVPWISFFNQLLVNCWFGAFGGLGPSWNPQTNPKPPNAPNQQLTICRRHDSTSLMMMMRWVASFTFNTKDWQRRKEHPMVRPVWEKKWSPHRLPKGIWV